MMNTKPPVSLLVWYQRLAGLCDSMTGLMLWVAPLGTLRLMGVRGAFDPVLIAFVGVFVLGVGLAYLLTARHPRSDRDWHRLQAVWLVTAISRSLVALFLVSQLVRGNLEIAWITVAGTDALLAGCQWVGLAGRWLEARSPGPGAVPSARAAALGNGAEVIGRRL